MSDAIMANDAIPMTVGLMMTPTSNYGHNPGPKHEPSGNSTAISSRQLINGMDPSDP
jgi:hypothetical protein